MTDFFKATMISLIISIILLLVLFAVTGIHIGFVIAMAFIYSAILFICFLFTWVIKLIKKTISPYLVFAVVSFVIGIGISIFSVYDMKIHEDEWFGGLVGAVLLVYVVPFIILLLIIDLIIWKVRKSKKKR